MGAIFLPEIRHVQSSEEFLFLQACHVNDAAFHYKELHKLSWSDIGQHYVAMSPDNPESVAGVIQVVDTRNDLADGYGEKHITRLAVDSTYRQRGIGSALVAHAVQVEREAGLKILSTQPKTESAESIFEKQGFSNHPLGNRDKFFRYLILG